MTGTSVSLTPALCHDMAATDTDTMPGARRLASSTQASGVALDGDEATAATGAAVVSSFRLGGTFWPCCWLLPCANTGVTDALTDARIANRRAARVNASPRVIASQRSSPLWLSLAPALE